MPAACFARWFACSLWRVCLLPCLPACLLAGLLCCWLACWLPLALLHTPFCLLDSRPIFWTMHHNIAALSDLCSHMLFPSSGFGSGLRGHHPWQAVRRSQMCFGFAVAGRHSRKHVFTSRVLPPPPLSALGASTYAVQPCCLQAYSQFLRVSFPQGSGTCLFTFACVVQSFFCGVNFSLWLCFPGVLCLLHIILPHIQQETPPCWLTSWRVHSAVASSSLPVSLHLVGQPRKVVHSVIASRSPPPPSSHQQVTSLVGYMVHFIQSVDKHTELTTLNLCETSVGFVFEGIRKLTCCGCGTVT